MQARQFWTANTHWNVSSISTVPSLRVNLGRVRDASVYDWFGAKEILFTVYFWIKFSERKFSFAKLRVQHFEILGELPSALARDSLVNLKFRVKELDKRLLFEPVLKLSTHVLVLSYLAFNPLFLTRGKLRRLEIDRLYGIFRLESRFMN